MARLFMAALERAGAKVELISEFRSFDKAGDPTQQVRLKREGEAEAHRIVENYRNQPKEAWPDLFFTYHVYHKAPDWIGPLVAEALDIPYYIAEASHAPKQENGRWASGYKAAANAIKKATRVFHMTRLDGACLGQLVSDPKHLIHFPPFIETKPDGQGDAAAMVLDAGGRLDRMSLLSVGMLRGGDKFKSFAQLSKTLPLIGGDDWQLLIVGDGPKESEIRELFQGMESRVHFLGRRTEAELVSLYSFADLYVWPAVGEAFGMAFLEAARSGLPSIACRVRGVPDVVADGESGILVDPDDIAALASAIRQALDDQELREQMLKSAIDFVAKERSLQAAADRLSDYMKEDVK
ncbi:glycosyltransferase [Sneathiella sp. P13V-1]|uniref:glycosyltransferase family 4 protein n=1 Tax=Sneathiella sp. P13V-1 TaxID=2697366 RepID=UPI00187B445B|nr:glycosyltransferase family 4 protein [Sneathiella sp. P13V-1]MBE7635828.1 glycosyltransferase [Sneathiella sp. P13V-1]